MKRELKHFVISLALLVSDEPQSLLEKHSAVTGGQLYLLRYEGNCCGFLFNKKRGKGAREVSPTCSSSTPRDP